jgi:RNA polymerase sigma-70 factor (ECF subfamily)
VLAGTPDQRAAGLWSDAQRRRLVALCSSITGDRSAAEDLAQETLLEAWRNLHKLHDPAGMDRWLAAIARNVCRREARRVGHDPVVAEPQQLADLGGEDLAVELDLERAELAELLDRALALLPVATRAVLVDRFVHESPYAEIAARHGLSVDAVSMRVSRGKLVLRTLFESQLREEAAAYGLVSSSGGGWRETRLWCENCGRCRLLMRREPAPGAISFRCPGCSPDPAVLTSRLSLANPYFARLVGDLVRPSAIAARTAAWVHSYYGKGAESGQVVCTRCGRRVALRRFAADDAERPGDKAQAGLLAVCGGCGEAVSSSLQGLALATPEVRLFRRSHRRLRLLPEYDVEHRGLDATVVRVQSASSSARIDAVFCRGTLRLLSVHGPTG